MLDIRNVFSPESWFGGHDANGMVPTYWSRSDLVMVAVGFQPTVIVIEEIRNLIRERLTALSA
jgi:hypothetical protein